jgi:hypothetical protein
LFDLEGDMAFHLEVRLGFRVAQIWRSL